MSFPGKNPSYKWLTLEPQSADPTSPNEGDIFRSDGTSRDEGLWVYESAAWTQISTGATLSTLVSLTLTPQSADPGSPVSGMIFVSDGTSRAAGLWEYNGTGWTQVTGVKYQEFTLKQAVICRLATTVAGILASDFDNGSTIDGTILVTSDIILIKNQATATENGVYTVNASGAPTRHTSADVFDELNNGYTAYIDLGTTNKNTQWFQTAVLTSFSTNQVWAVTPATYNMIVPTGVFNMQAFIVGGGGGGGGMYDVSADASGGGGGGGQYYYHSFLTTPGESLTITIGKGGLGGKAGTTGTQGVSGGSSSITGSFGTINAFGGGGGGYGRSGNLGTNGTPTLLSKTVSISTATYGRGGGGGVAIMDTTAGTNGNDGVFMIGGSGSGTVGAAGGVSDFITTGAAGGAYVGSRSGGGGGGASFGAGAAGGAGGTGVLTPTAATGYGGGGGGTGARTVVNHGGRGRNGYVKLSW